MTFEMVVFYFLSLVSLGSAGMVVMAKQPFHSALWLGLTLFSVAGHYLLLRSPFLAVIQVLIYIGAVLVLFIFAIMLTKRGGGYLGKLPEILSATVFTVLLAYLTASSRIGSPPEPKFNLSILGETIFTKYILQFELVGLLLAVTIVGAVFLAIRGEEW